MPRARHQGRCPCSGTCAASSAWYGGRWCCGCSCWPCCRWPTWWAETQCAPTLPARLAQLVQDLAIDAQARFPDLSALRRRPNPAARLLQMAAVVEPALGHMGAQVGHEQRQVLRRHLLEPELLEARRIDEPAAAFGIQPVPLRRGGGVAARVQ